MEFNTTSGDDSKEEIVGDKGVIMLLGGELGRGVYCGVFDKELVAVKEISRHDVDKEGLQELEHLRTLDHKNIVKYKFSDSGKRHLFIVLEKCDFTLARFVEDKNAGFCPLDVLWQVSDGMAYLHDDKDMVHRDLKPSNILMLFRDDHWVAKITDFGISKKLPQDRTRVTQSAIKGTCGYMAPEQMRGEKIGQKADIYSLGLIFHYALSDGKHPYGDNTLEAERKMCDESIPPDLSAMKEEYKHDAETLVFSMIAHQKDDRPPIREVQAHLLFWDPEKKLSFIHIVSDFIIHPVERYNKMQPIFEKKLDEIANDWRQKVCDACPIVGEEITSMKTKRQQDGVCDLMRNIRNLKNHYDEKKTEFKEQIGRMPDGVYYFFKKLFPKLFNYAYDIMKDFKQESRFIDFYVYKKLEHLRQKVCDDKTAPLPCTTGFANDVEMEELSNESQEKESSGNDESSSSAPKPSRSLKRVGATEKNPPNSAPGTGVTQELQVLNVGTEGSKKLVLGGSQKELAENDVVDLVSPIKGVDNEEVNLPESTSRTADMEVINVDGSQGGNKLVLREYQKELAEQALRGANSLIVAPTGSGKTAVLTKVIEHHLSLNPQTGRVMFMVPKTALARQQFRYLESHLKGCSINYMIGLDVESAPVGQRILNYQVTVLTPQILINELAKDWEQRYVSFDDLSMLIFDECHNATKNHPYRQLMDMLLDFEVESASKKHPIQVIGVTASPGVGKAKDKVKVKNKLIELLGNLNIMSAPSTVEENVEELARHHSMVKEFFLQVQTETVFAHEVETFIMELENRVLQLLEKNTASIRKPPSKKASQPYDNWIEDLNSIAKTEVQDGESSRCIISCTANLKLYHYLLQLKDLVPNAIEQAKRKVSFLTEGPENEEMERKREELKMKAVGIQTPMFDKLQGILKEELKQNPMAQCLVFVEWKLTAESLHDCISKTMEGVRSTFLIGTQSSGGIRGMTKNEQDTIVEDFRNKKYNVLVTTSIAEAGLDFNDCSLVVMYNYVTGEVGREQRKGRGRSKNSKAIIMTAVGSDLKKREQENICRVKATKIAIDDIKKVDNSSLKEKVLMAQQKHRNERMRKLKVVRTAVKNCDPPLKWKILCGNCKNFLTTGDKLRHIDNTHTVVKDKEFFDRTEKRNVKKEKAPNVLGLADYHCKGFRCGEKVALGMEYENMLCPALSIKKIVLKSDTGAIRSPKKRKNLPFEIDISLDDCEEGDDDDMFETIDRTKAQEESTDTSLNDSDCFEFLEITG